MVGSGPATDSDGRDIDARIAAMRRNFGLGNRGEAMRLCQELMLTAPDRPDPYLVAALMAESSGQAREAESLVQRALAIAPGRADALGLLASLKARRGDFDGAIEAYQACVERNPADARSLLGLVGALTASGRGQAACQLLERMLLGRADLFAEADQQALWLKLASLQFAEGQTQKALRSHAVAWNRRPPPVEATRAFRDGGDLADWCADRGHETRRIAALELSRLGGGDSRPAWLCAVPDARVIGATSVPASADGAYFADGLIPNPEKLAMADVSRFQPDILASGGGRILATCHGETSHAGAHLFLGFHENFGHWMTNILARLVFLDHAPDLRGLPVVVGAEIGTMHRACLARLGYGPDRVVTLAPGMLHRFETLWIPTMPYHGHGPFLYWAPPIFDFLRRALGAETAPRAGPGRRLFITRRTARWRRLVNEDAVLDAVAELGFERLDPADLPIGAQIALAGEAEAIVGPFGAGMMLMLFARPGTHVVELKYEVGSMDIHPLMSGLIGLDYRDVVGGAIADSGNRLNHDFEVDPARVREAVAAALGG